VIVPEGKGKLQREWRIVVYLKELKPPTVRGGFSKTSLFSLLNASHVDLSWSCDTPQVISSTTNLGS
jgi:hypothetical protein